MKRRTEHLVEKRDGRREFLWISAWDSVADANEFALAYTRIAASVGERASLSAPPGVTTHGREVRIATPALAHWAEASEPLGRRQRVNDLAGLRAHFGE